MNAEVTPTQIADLRRQKYNATAVYLRKLHSDLLLLRVKSDFPRPPHKPGQYTVLGMGFWEPRFPGCQEEHLEPADLTKLARRAYSISCPVLDDAGALLDVEKTDWLEFYIVLVRESSRLKPPALTPRLFMLRQGERLHVGETITGHYNLDGVEPDHTVLFLSTGTGEAPHNYMLWQLLAHKHPGRILAACCVRYGRDLGYRGLHTTLMARYPNYTYVPLVTREANPAARKVYIQDLITSGELERLLGQPLDPARTHVYLCGNPNMIGVPLKTPEGGEAVFPQPPGVIEILTRRGFQVEVRARKFRGNIHYEEYW